MSSRSSIAAEIRATLPTSAIIQPSTAGAENDDETPYQLSEDPEGDGEVLRSIQASSSIQERLKTYLSSHLGTELLGSVALGTFGSVAGAESAVVTPDVGGATPTSVSPLSPPPESHATAARLIVTVTKARPQRREIDLRSITHL